MPKHRNQENKGLPERWRFTHGAYYYQVPPGLEHLWDDKQTFRLGKTLPEAYKIWAKRIESTDKANNIGQLLDRYAIEVIPAKAIATQETHNRAIKKVRAVFGHMPLAALTPQDIYKFADKRGSRASARMEINLLSHAYTKAVEWGYIAAHPFKGEIRLEGSKPRTRYIEDWELEQALIMPVPEEKGGAAMIQAYIELKLLLGLRQSDMLRLKEADLKEDGIHVTPHKTQNSSGKSVIYEWSDDLRIAVANARAARPLDISKWLFCTRYGEAYIDETNGRAYGFASIWQRFMARLLKETEIKMRFAERDIRAKTSSDAESDERGRELLSHSNVAITRRVYRRKPTKIKPLR